jgi:hypothetical protein
MKTYDGKWFVVRFNYSVMLYCTLENSVRVRL